ncbi:hypothetical protein COU60_03650 [Candidatus Pacearchaeota archaeon CG10_big_fil_rev_8_21_14_0_10_34_76]|nr:MAG: hypothetical protein COU60_03650 [Candidatus Pacearchaeota archaeon CG10_big_fil_rev_8_21_14_0_10_34_76]
MKNIKLINRILLGLVMLVPGLFKLAGMTGIVNFDVPGFLASLGFPAASALAWLLLIVEIGSGIAILSNWRLKQVIWAPVVILLVAAFAAYRTDVAQIVIHLTLISNYLLLSSQEKPSRKK